MRGHESIPDVYVIAEDLKCWFQICQLYRLRYRLMRSDRQKTTAKRKNMKYHLLTI